MKLLEVQKVKEENSLTNQERIKRVSKLNAEESAVVKRINQFHEDEKKQREIVQNNLIKVRQMADVEKGKIKQEISVLFREVESLEKRKAKALEPIDKVRKEVDDRLEEVKKKESENEKHRNQIDTEKENLLERVEKISDREQEISERDTKSKKKHNAILAEENRLKESAEKLGKDWSAFHSEVHKKNAEIIRREKEVEDGRRANENFKIALDKKEKEQAEHDRQIADRYGTLGRAIEEARKKHGVNL